MIPCLSLFYVHRTHAARSTSSVRSRRACPAATTAMSRLLRWGRTSNAALRPTFRYAYGWLFSQNIAFCGKMVMFQFLCNKTVFCFDVGVCFQRMYFPHAPGLGLGIICGYMDEEKKHTQYPRKYTGGDGLPMQRCDRRSGTVGVNPNVATNPNSYVSLSLQRCCLICTFIWARFAVTRPHLLLHLFVVIGPYNW